MMQSTEPKKVLRVLILEDVPTDAELIQEELRIGGIEFIATRVDTKDSYMDALDRSSPDIILSDYSLPSFDGESALLIAREKAPGLPFIFVTGALGEDRAVDLMKRGATDFVLKDRLGRIPLCIKRALEEVEEKKRRQQAEEALNGERRRLYDVLETLPVYVILLTKDYHVPFANRFFRERFGESQGRRCFDYLFKRREPCENCETFKVFEKDTPHQWHWVGPDGRNYEIHDFLFTDSDGSTMIMEMGIDVTLQKRSEKELRKAHDQVRFFASQCLTAQETERKRIAGELHDSIAASIAATKLRIEKIEDDMKRGQAGPEALEDPVLKLMEINNEVRRIMSDLRPGILDDLGIVPAMEWLCREYQKTYPHISVEKQIKISEEDVPDPIKTPIFRISQEAMNNIAKYSHASLVNVSIRKEDSKMLLAVKDNGKGFDRETVRKGMGLSTMRERAELSGGSFEIESMKGTGTVIRASWPLD